MIEALANLPALGQAKLAAVITALRREAQGGLASTLSAEMLRGPLLDSHRADAAPTEWSPFDTATPTTGIITGTVGAADVELFASVSAASEAGHIITQRSNLWTLSAGAGGAQGWVIVGLEWGLTAPSNFTMIYDAIPGTGYLPLDTFAVDFRGHWYKPLHGRQIDSGGAITVKMTVRPFGPNGTTVFWPGAGLSSISSAACNMINRMSIFNPDNYGPLQMRPMFKPNGAAKGPGRKALLAGIFGGGNISRLISGALGGIVDGAPPPNLK